MTATPHLSAPHLLNIDVKIGPLIVGSPDNPLYKNDTIPRGAVFIANYMYIPGQNQRTGSDVDVECLLELFAQMTYQVFILKDKATKTETMLALRKFKEYVISHKDNLDSVIVIFMSHGEGVADIFLTYDGIGISEEEITREFNKQNCSEIFEKPKLFIFKFCRGTKTAPNLKVKTKKKRRDESKSHMVIIHSCFYGYVSSLTTRGSPFINTICRVLMKYACDSDFDELQERIQRDAKERIDISLYFKKDFYFNPNGKMKTAPPFSLSEDEPTLFLPGDGHVYIISNGL